VNCSGGPWRESLWARGLQCSISLAV